MQITVEIPDDLATQVRARGLTPEGYIRALVEEAVRTAHQTLAPAEPKMDIETFIRGMASFSEKIPQLPDEAYTRESFYRDHD